MNRTMKRPLPSGMIKPGTALLLTFLFGLTGFFLLFFGNTFLSAILGTVNIICYNAVYTPLKKKTGYAVLAGALTGSIPPMIGWTAAGGNLFEPVILFIALFIYLWQIPHFLLILQRFKDEYNTAGFPSFFKTSNEKWVKTIIFLWLLSSSISTLVFPLFHIITGIIGIGTLITLNGFIIIYFCRIIYRKNNNINFGSAFRSIYIYQALILSMLVIDSLK